MATDPDIDDLKQMVATLAETARELGDATRIVAETTKGQSNNSTIHIDAGGISAGLALSGVGVCLVSFMLFAMWTMWRMSEADAQQQAWTQVWHQKMAQMAEKAEHRSN